MPPAVFTSPIGADHLSRQLVGILAHHHGDDVGDIARFGEG